MPGKLLFLVDDQARAFSSPTFEELCSLPLQAGPHLVIAKGAIRLATTEQFPERFELRLQAVSMGGMNLGLDETEFKSPASNLGGGQGTFSLIVAAVVPHEGGASGGAAPVPPPPRAILSARSEGGDATALVHHVRIAALPVDEILLTTL